MSKPNSREPLSFTSFVTWLLVDFAVGVGLTIGLAFMTPYISLVFQTVQQWITQSLY